MEIQVMNMMMAVAVRNLATPFKSNGGCNEVDEDGNGNGMDDNLNARINIWSGPYITESLVPYR